ncbi:MAG TPA: hypothetical protein VIN75_26760, partial [Burkholderiaceae bacterium]
MTSRAPPPRFEPCAFDGVRYDAAYASSDAAPRTRSGGVVAIDEATGRALWTVVLWTTPVEDAQGLFHPPRFLRRVSRGDEAGELRVEDEHGVLYVVDLATRAFRTVEPPRKPASFPRPPE